MPKKPDKNKQIHVDYKVYQKLEREAKENDETIKEVVEGYVINEEDETGKKLKKKGEKKSGEQNGNWERVNKSE